MKKAMTVPEFSEQMSISTVSVYRLIKSGEIPSLRLGGRVLIPISAVEKMLDGALRNINQKGVV